MKKLLFGTAGIPHSSVRPDIISGLFRIKELGLSAMELEFVQGIKMSVSSAEVIRDVARNLGIILTAHAPYFINLNSEDFEKRERSKRWIIKASHIAKKAGAISLAFHPGYYGGRSKEETFRTIRDELTSLSKDVDIDLRPEVAGKKSSFGDLEEIIRLPNVKPCIDFAHLHARTSRYNSYSEFMEVFKMLEDVLGRDVILNMHIHVSGIVYSEKGERAHVNLKKSDFNWVDFVRALFDSGAKGVVICESPNLEEDALLLKRLYDEIGRGVRK